MKEQNFKETEIGKIPVDWEVDNLNNLSVKIASGKSNTTNFYGGKYPIYGSTGLIGNKEYYDYEGDKLTVARVGANAGLLNKISGKYCISDNTLFIETNDLINNDFLFEFLDSINLNKYIFGSGQPLITGGILKMLEIPLPPLAEQEKIAEVLSDTDLWIESTEALLAKKRQIKKGAMQKLLSPKEDWEVKKLGEVLQFGSGKDYKHLQSGDIPVYGTGGIMTYVNQYLYDGESVGIGRKGTIDKPVFLKNKFWTVDTLFFTYSFIDAVPKYIYYQFLLIKWKEYNEASGVPSLNKNTLEQIEIKIPSLKIQREIAEILSSMDLEIEFLENRLQKARNIKQGMMQDLLTGKVRLG